MTQNTNVLFSSEKGTYFLLKKRLECSDDWVLIMDRNTEKYCKSHFLKKLDLSPNLEIILNEGEFTKNLGQIEQIYDVLLKNKIGRKAMFVNLGGGIVSDMGGFAASTYKRGLNYINIPTSLLAMVDAAIGGKTGVNFNGIKNQIGSFHHPLSVLIDSDYLKSLNDYELRSGFAEMIKHALIADKHLWSELSVMKDIDAIAQGDELIRKAIGIKSSIVASDPLEEGNRKLLNFGHTIGHAIESHFNNNKQSISHGHAVAVGMICETYLSFVNGLISENDVKEVGNTINGFFKPLDLNEAHFDAMVEVMFHDKKNRGGQLNFTLLKSIGEGIIDQTSDIESIKKAFVFYKNL